MVLKPGLELLIGGLGRGPLSSEGGADAVGGWPKLLIFAPEGLEHEVDQ